MKAGELGYDIARNRFNVDVCGWGASVHGNCSMPEHGVALFAQEGAEYNECLYRQDGKCQHPKHPTNMPLAELVLDEL